MSNLHKFKEMIYSSQSVKNIRQLNRALQKTEYFARRNLKAGRIVVINIIEVEKPKFIKPKNRNAFSGTCAGE